jgi:hypothetical protein
MKKGPRRAGNLRMLDRVHGISSDEPSSTDWLNSGTVTIHTIPITRVSLSVLGRDEEKIKLEGGAWNQERNLRRRSGGIALTCCFSKY